MRGGSERICYALQSKDFLNGAPNLPGRLLIYLGGRPKYSLCVGNTVCIDNIAPLFIYFSSCQVITLFWFKVDQKARSTFIGCQMLHWINVNVWMEILVQYFNFSTDYVKCVSGNYRQSAHFHLFCLLKYFFYKVKQWAQVILLLNARWRNQLKTSPKMQYPGYSLTSYQQQQHTLFWNNLTLNALHLSALSFFSRATWCASLSRVDVTRALWQLILSSTLRRITRQLLQKTVHLYSVYIQCSI